MEINTKGNVQYVQCNDEGHSPNYFCIRIAVSVTQYECVSAVVPQSRGKKISSFLRHILLSCPSPQALLYVSTLSYKVRESALNLKCVFRFLSEIFLILLRIQGDFFYKFTLQFMQTKSYYCRISFKIEFPRQTFEKPANIKFHENSSGGSRVLPCRKADKQTNTDRHAHRVI